MVVPLVLSSALMLIPAVYAARIGTPISVAHASAIAVSACFSMGYWATRGDDTPLSMRLLVLDHTAAAVRLLVDVAVLIATWPKNVPRSLMATALALLALTLYNMRCTIALRESGIEPGSTREPEASRAYSRRVVVAHFAFHLVGIAGELILMRAAYGA